MTNPETIARQVELLHVYHLDLWSEIEAQLRTLKASQSEIEKLRNGRTLTQTPALAAESARLLAGHVQAMKGRVKTLSSSVSELEETVAVLCSALGC